MSDTPESDQRNPRSSSSSNTAGTQALSISIESDEKKDAVAKTDAPISPKFEEEPDAFPHPVASNENQLSTPDAEPVATEQIDEALPVEDTAFVPASGQEILQSSGLTDEPVLEPAAETGTDAFQQFAETSQDASEQTAPAPQNASESVAETPQTANEQLAETSQDSNADSDTDSDIEVETALSASQPAADAKTTDELREAVRQRMKGSEENPERAFVMFEQMSQNFQVAMEDVRNDAARISFKLMEFAQANFRNNVELAREYAAARSVPDVFNVQASYFKRQMDLMNKQTEELRRLTSEIASKNTAQIQSSIKDR